jgi:hypothetical protein
MGDKEKGSRGDRLTGKHVTLDGKTLRRSHDRYQRAGSNSNGHLVR